MTLIGYLGPEGTYSEMAALDYCRRHGLNMLEYQLVPIKTIPKLFEWLQGGRDRKIVVPIENSVEGAVLPMQDQVDSFPTTTQSELFETWDAHIDEEFSIPIENYLLVKKGTQLNDITDVVSHPQPIGQCQSFIQSGLGYPLHVFYADSTARAAEMVANMTPLYEGANPMHMASIGSVRLAERYGLVVALPTSIQDSSNNRTRFWVISRSNWVAGPSNNSNNSKTTLVFSTLKDQPGGLYDVLGEFAKRDINLTSISSRPTKTVLGEYLFFIDFLGHWYEETVREALIQVKEKTSYFRLLGSYPSVNVEKGN
ncbi:prephenate dehydratase [bacterium]|nr:prephenate dehydratase [bacterium]